MNTIKQAIPFSLAVLLLKRRMVSETLKENGDLSKMKAFMEASIDEIEAQPEWAKMVMDAHFESEVSVVSRIAWMSQMHAREYERANRPRTLDTQVGPIVLGSPTLAIKGPGVHSEAAWNKLVCDKVEAFLTKAAQKAGPKGIYPVLTHEVRTPRDDHHLGSIF